MKEKKNNKKFNELIFDEFPIENLNKISSSKKKILNNIEMIFFNKK